MAITSNALAAQAALDAQLQQVTDQQVRLLTAAWVLAWSELAAELQDTLEELFAAGGRISRATMRRSLRLRRALAAAADQLSQLATDAGIMITSDLVDVVDTAAKAQTDIIDAMLPHDDESALDLLDRAWDTTLDPSLDAIVRRTTEQIESALDRLSADAEDAMRRELIRGVTVGANPREAARRMVARTEGEFNGGLTRALRLARTEMVDAHREAAKVGQDRHAEVLQGWVWLCHLGPRTCASCLVRHGSVHPLDEPGPYDHPQGRCSRAPKTKSWADLGFEGIEEPEDLVTDAREWFDALPVEQQVQILGRERLRMLRAGEISWEDLAVLRKNPRWRDSWQVATLAQLRSRRRARAS